MLSPTDEWFAYERQRSALCQAEHARLVTQALRGRRPLYSPALVWLGRQLSDWGQRLLRRYGSVESACATVIS